MCIENDGLWLRGKREQDRQTSCEGRGQVRIEQRSSNSSPLSCGSSEIIVPTPTRIESWISRSLWSTAGQSCRPRGAQQANELTCVSTACSHRRSA